jgi:asparagine synthase (glutamine-hydrolysing)
VCGIVAILNLDGETVSEGTVAAMTRAIAHRGPDGEGVLVDGPAALGNRRLAVIDPSPAGAQPMSTADGSLSITFNGEIYNFRQIRRELERAGRRFRSETDTEVVLNAYAEWGPASVERLNGMFALAIWDARRRCLFVARDRYGIKPLYVAHAGRSLLFASEIKSFLEHPAFRVQPSLPHLFEYLTFQNVFSRGTLFDGVDTVPAGHRWTIDARGGGSSSEPYWDFRFVEEDAHGADPREYEEEVDRLFRQAVERQLVSDVPVGSYLSGGMDSGSIAAIATRTLPGMPTFTIGFDLSSASGLELGWDERSRAEALSYRLGTEQYEAVLKAGDMERCLPRLVWHLEDLRVGQSYPNYYLARLARGFVTVVLSGAGGDELFAGYPWRYYRAVVNDGFDDYVEKYYRFWHRLLPNRVMPELFQPGVWSQVRDVRTIDVFRTVLAGHGTSAPQSPEQYVNESLYLEAKTFLHGLLVVEDKLSMAHSLETRVPFLDNDLVDFVQRTPVRLKLRDLDHMVEMNENEPAPKTERYYEQMHDGKLLLRSVMSRYVPAEVTARAKQGFSGPDASWFRGDSLDYVRRALFRPDAAIYEFLRPDTVQSLVEEHLQGKENRRLLLWSLLSLEQWCRVFLHGERP